MRARFLETFIGVETEADLLPIYLDNPGTAPSWAITQWEALGSDGGDIRVYVQLPLTETEAHLIGTQILGLTCLDFPDLGFVVVRGADGIDVNVPRDEMPLCRA